MNHKVRRRRIMFLHVCVRASIRPSRTAVSPCVRPRLCFRDISIGLHILSMVIDFRQTFCHGASWDKDELIRFCGQKLKGQGDLIEAEASSTRRCRRVQLSSYLKRSCKLPA